MLLHPTTVFLSWFKLGKLKDDLLDIGLVGGVPDIVLDLYYILSAVYSLFFFVCI